MLTIQTLAEAMDYNASMGRYQQLHPGFVKAMHDAQINTVRRAAMFIAQLGHESVGLKYMQEIWGPTSQQAGYEGRRDLGNTVAGDGYRFRGRGPIQVTGRHNYGECSRWAHAKGLVPTPTYFVDLPDEMSSDRYGFVGAVWYWTTRNLNSYADRGDVDGATRVINGGYYGLEDRRRRYNKAISMGDRILPGGKVTQEQMDAIVNRITGYINGYLWPVISDTKDNREQLTGSRDLVKREDGSIDVQASYKGWPQLGNKTIVDALAEVMEDIKELKAAK